MATAQIHRELLPKQLDFVRATESEVLYSGAFGAGKSRAVCEKVLVHAATYAKNRVGLCRKTLKSLKATTMVTLLKGDGSQPPVLPAGTYDYNKSDQLITLKGNGSEIVCFGLDDWQKIGSLNLGACGVDEAVETVEEDWIQLRGRCRNDSDLCRQLFGACNPGPPSHYLAVRFGLCEGTQPATGCRAIQTSSTDNFFLPADYVEWLMSLTGVHAARYRDGKWVGFVGLVFDTWERRIHAKQRDGPWQEVVGVVDEGYTNPAVLLSVGIDGDGRFHVFRQFYERQVQPAKFVEECKRRRDQDGISTFIVDPSAAGLIADMRAGGLSVAKTEDVSNDVFDGIKKVQDRLAVAGDGLPRLTVDADECPDVAREFESYLWKPGKDAPVMQFDHAMSAIRYGIMWYDKGNRLTAEMISGIRGSGQQREGLGW